MKLKPALYELVRLHSEIAAEIKSNKVKAATLRANLKHVSAVIQLIDPSFDLRKIIPKRKHPRNGLFKRGECLTGALNILRTAEKPLTARQIAALLLQSKGIPDPPKRLFDKTAIAVYAGLKFRRKISSLEIVGDGLKPIRWSLPA